MSEEKGSGKAVAYLYAAIKCADWIPDGYKNLAAQHEKEPEYLKELYLCAVDGVPLDRMESIHSPNSQQAIRILRRKFWEERIFGAYGDEMSGLRRQTDQLEEELRNVGKNMEKINQWIMGSDNPFPQNQPPEEQSEVTELDESTFEPEETGSEDEETQDPLVENVKKLILRKKREKGSHGQDKSEEAEAIETFDDSPGVPNFGTQKEQEFDKMTGQPNEKVGLFRAGIGISKRTDRKKRQRAAYIEQLIEDEYSKEQIEFILSCLENGKTVDEIKKISSPKLPVYVMERLLTLNEREDKNYG